MTIGDFLNQATRRLKNSGIETARLDVLVLLEDELKLERSHLLAHLDRPVGDLKIRKLNKKITQRSKHIPLAYIRGKAAFYGRDFLTNKYVLVPRSESEAMIDLLKNLPLPTRPRIADIGTGSGCLGLTAALEIPGSTVELYDIDQRALRVAKANARKIGVKAEIKKADLLGGIATAHYDALLANLPYVPNGYEINRAAGFEPIHAIFAGPDGLDFYKRFWAQISALPHLPTNVITESLPSQHKTNSLLAAAANYSLVNKTIGFAQLFSLNAER